MAPESSIPDSMKRSRNSSSCSPKNSAAFWLGLQMDTDLDTAEDELAERIKREVQLYAAAGPG